MRMSHCGNAISGTNRRRHERSSKKPRGKAGDDGGKSGGNGSDEVSSMAAAAMCWGDALVQDARRIDKVVGDARDDEGGSGEGDVGDNH